MHALLVDLGPLVSATKVLGVDVDDRVTVAHAMLEPERCWLFQASRERLGFRRGASGNGPGVGDSAGDGE